MRQQAWDKIRKYSLARRCSIIGSPTISWGHQNTDSADPFFMDSNAFLRCDGDLISSLDTREATCGNIQKSVSYPPVQWLIVVGVPLTSVPAHETVGYRRLPVRRKR